MPNVKAVVALYGDLHLSSKNYGAHRDYPKESIEYLSKVTEVVRKRNVTHLIGCGDFSFGRFHSLEYRLAVEQQLAEQYRLTNGNHWMIFGNHDEAGYGYTERDYYIAKGLFKPSENLTIGTTNISMIDYGKSDKVEPIIVDDDKHNNIIVAHNYFKFDNVRLPDFGKAISLDTFDRWFGADMIVCGHIHKILDFSGYIVKGEMAHECQVHYLGCMTRPQYREGFMDDYGQVMIITIYDNDEINIEMEKIKLWEIAESFNLAKKAAEKDKKAEQSNRIDISDIVNQLDAHDRHVGNPEDIIASLDGVDDKYKEKAIALLKLALG